MEQKNFVLALVLSLGFILLWSVFVVPRFSPPAPPASTAPLNSPATVDNTMPDSRQSITQGKVETVTVRNADNTIVLDPRGGGVQSWMLNAKSQTFDLVRDATALPLPLASFPDTLFKISVQPDGAVMRATLPNHIEVTKTLTLSPTGHLHTIQFRFHNPSASAIQLEKWEWGWGPGLNTVPTEQKENAGLIRGLTMGPLKAHVVHENDQQPFGSWVGIDNRYFLVAFIPTSAHITDFRVTGKKETTRVHLVETTPVPPHSDITLAYDLYVGPKGYTQLKTYHRHIEESVDFGTFGPIGKLILSALYRLKAVTGNYGVSIIILTLCLQVMLMPLTLKSFKAANAMKKLQPKIAKLQELYKGDPKRLNVEMMNLYKSSGTNPFGGCLPMLLQLPIFWALFTTLRNAYELRGAPFVGWIHDLSVHDPYYILPVVMGGGMFLQQRMTGATTDPTQRQMMYMMPIMFTFMFMNFPAGLVLYWMTNSFATITFQYFYLRATTGTPNRPEIIRP